MAGRRMFTDKIIESDAFLEMPLSSQALYFHYCMNADDDGFVNNPTRIQRMIGAATDDDRVLIAKSFVLPFESGIKVIKHWRMHNLLRKDRYNETEYLEEKSMLYIKDNGSYTFDENQGKPALATKWQPNDNQRLPQYSIGKESIINNTHTPPISPKGEWEDYEKVLSVLKETCPIIYNRHAKLINEKTKISVAGEVNKALDEILQVYSLEELRELFEKLNQTYLVKPKYQNIDLAWVLNNIPRINQAVKEVEESQSRQPLYEVDEDGVVIGSVEEKPHRTKPVRQSKQEYMKSENERIMGVLGRLWQEAKEEEERAKNGQE